MFSALALLCACVASGTLPRIWKYLGKGLKAVGISLTALASVVHFWYQSVYVPENTLSGIYYDLTLGPIIRSGSDRLVSVDLTMEDESSVTVRTLESMVVVSGIDPTLKSRILGTPLMAISRNSLLFPNAAYSSVFLVSVPDPGIEALHFEITLYYARTTGLALGRPISIQEHLRSCPGGKSFEWPIEESELRSFTEGAQVLYSDWCADSKVPGGPFVKVELGTPATARAFESQVSTSSRDYVLSFGGN